MDQSAFHAAPNADAAAPAPPAAREPGRAAVQFDPVQAALPLGVESQCLHCENVVPGILDARQGRVVLDKTCPTHGPMQEVLFDVLFSEREPDRAGSPRRTYRGAPIRPVVRSLPKTVETLCPECGRNILGRAFDWQGNVMMEKTCPEHGYVKDRMFTGTELFLKMQQWSFREGAGLENPQVADATHCPSACGICNIHQSHTLLGQVDLTNRCNLSCPICFANANVQGFVSEPTFAEVVTLLEQLRSYRPVPASAVQLTGGEPTIHRDFFAIVRKAKELGFSHIQVASNGIKFANPEFAMAAAEAGLHTIYLQFDGTDDAVYEYIRGRALLDIKLRALENIHAAGMKACLVPTLVRGVNDDQVAKILQFAIDHIHVVSAIAYQPVSFTGRISRAEREAQRYTLGDLANDLAATGMVDPRRDFYPLSIVAPLSRLLAALTGDPKITATAHPTCSSGTYFVVDKHRHAVPVTRFLDVEGLFRDMEDLAAKIETSHFATVLKLKAPYLFAKHFKAKEAPEGMNVKSFMHALRGMTDKGTGRGKAGETTYRTLMAAGMHFQDRYNFDVERVKRCVIHYSTPEGVFPFCAYNCGPVHREWVEGRHTMTLEAWKARNHEPVAS